MLPPDPVVLVCAHSAESRAGGRIPYVSDQVRDVVHDLICELSAVSTNYPLVELDGDGIAPYRIIVRPPAGLVGKAVIRFAIERAHDRFSKVPKREEEDDGPEPSKSEAGVAVP